MTTAAHKAEWLRNNLKKDELYAGLILGDKDEPDHHLIMLTLHKDASMTWKNAMAAAKKAGARLPTRREASLLFANLKQHFQPAWYWTSDQHAGDDDYAWCQYFGYGIQGNSRKSLYDRVVLVRSSAIQ
jgi:hypothetical protein